MHIKDKVRKAIKKTSGDDMFYPIDDSFSMEAEAHILADILNEWSDSMVSIEALENSEDTWIQASYYSKKVAKTIVIQSEMRAEPNNEDELVDLLAGLEQEARDIEASITIKHK